MSMSYESKLRFEGSNASFRDADASRTLHLPRRRQQDETDVSPSPDPDVPIKDSDGESNEAFIAALPQQLADYVKQTEKMRLDQESFEQAQHLIQSFGLAFSGAASTVECRDAFSRFDPADPDPQAIEFRNYSSSEYDKFGYL